MRPSKPDLYVERQFSPRKVPYLWMLKVFPVAFVAASLLLHSYTYPRSERMRQGAAPQGDFNEPVDYSTSRLPKIAICLTGGARKFELTAPSIFKHLISTYSPSDVFIVAPLDEDSHKFSLLNSSPSPIQALRILSPIPIPEQHVAAEILRGAGSPNGVQGLLQYFNLVESCLDLIEEREETVGGRYEWVVRTRVDSYWNAAPTPISNLPRDAYTVPLGSKYYGLNDRLGIGVRSMAPAALGRLRMLTKIRDFAYYDLNSEKSLGCQFKVANIPVTPTYFPFCIVSARSYGFPPKFSGVPVAFMGSLGALSGAKCRPCRPAATGIDALAILADVHAEHGGIGLRGQVELCNASGPWPDDWEQIYDEIAGEKEKKIRTTIKSRSYANCVLDLTALKSRVARWASPIPEAICRRRELGELKVVAGAQDRGERFAVFLRPLEKLGSDAVMYSSGFLPDVAFHKELMKLLPKMRIHAFDATEEAMVWDEQEEAQSLLSTLQHYIATLAPVEGNVTLGLVVSDGKPTRWWTPLPIVFEPYFLERRETYEASTIPKFMKNLSNKRVDLLFVGLLVEDAAWLGLDAAVCQLVVAFDWTVAAAEEKRGDLFAKLETGGMHLATCLGAGNGVEQCTFFSSKHCEY